MKTFGATDYTNKAPQNLEDGQAHRQTDGVDPLIDLRFAKGTQVNTFNGFSLA